MIDEKNLNLDVLRGELRKIKYRMLRGELSYEQAKAEAQPVVDGFNWLVMDICFKYGKRIKTYSFRELIKSVD